MDEFYASIGGKDVNGAILPGPWPYTTEMKDRHGRVHGIRECYLPEGDALEKTRYYLEVGSGK